MRDLLLVVDGNSLLHRAFHALPLMDNNGVYTNAVHGFMMMFFKVLRDYSPVYAAVAFDEHGPTFRHQVYADYKAGRRATPDELKSQFPILKEILSAMHVGVLSCAGWEADDILGTLAKKCEGSSDLKCMLLTGDRDALQLVSDESMLLFTRKGITDAVEFTPALVQETYGIAPRQVTDWKGLMGDASDNIPGIPGVGEKTAVRLLDQYGTLENVLDHGDEIKGKLGEKVRDNRDLALFSKKLATIVPEAPVPFSPEEWRLDRLGDGVPALRKYRLNQLLKQLADLGASAPETAEAPSPAAEEAPRPEWEPLSTPEEISSFLAGTGSADLYLTCGTDGMTLYSAGRLARAETGGDLLSPGMSPEEALGAVARGLGNRPLHVHDGKRLMHLFADLDLPVPAPVWDTMLAQYLLSPLDGSYPLGKYTSPDAYGLSLLEGKQRARLESEGMLPLMDGLELPLQTVLFDMEEIGFKVNPEVLRELKKEWSLRADELREEIFRLIGTGSFNLNSPQQLGKVLFDTLGLPGGKKNSRGWSTDVETLEKLRDEHPAIEKILEYRQVVKLNSTYTDALLEKTDREGRIHSVFDQTGTATGRISSSEPNLQNIPVRTAMGREIRRAFIPREGWRLCDADYSQIELRVLGHLSGDEAMTDAFLRGQDVHTRTASEVYGVPMDAVTPEMRRSAKAVNFGLVYGISEFGLARNIGISRREAHDFITRYYARYPGVKRYMDESVLRGRSDGYTVTLMGRRRPLPEIKSPNGNVRAFGDRVAMNAPVQGSAADIIKAAMISVHRQLKKEGLKARLILQVHDELLIECPPEEEERVNALLKECMESACPLRVPLTVEVHSGESWYETK